MNNLKNGFGGLARRGHYMGLHGNLGRRETFERDRHIFKKARKNRSWSRGWQNIEFNEILSNEFFGLFPVSLNSSNIFCLTRRNNLLRHLHNRFFFVFFFINWILLFFPITTLGIHVFLSTCTEYPFEFPSYILF